MGSMGSRDFRYVRFIFIAFLVVCNATAFADPLPRAKAGASKTPEPPEVIPNAWPKLSDEEQASALAEMKKFADDAQTKFNHPLKLIETKYFLFSSDLSATEAKNWAGLLDKMYARLAEMFAIPKGENIWRGKALIFVFAKKSDFAHFEHEMFQGDPGFAIGLCHQQSNGLVVVSFMKQRDELEFAHVLVHESVHGFIHRFRTPTRIPSWANEGLAETIATELVPQPGRSERVKSNARAGLEQHGESVDDFFTAAHIGPWQYPVAESLCTFMIAQSKKGYVDFIKGIKDGIEPMECLTTKYKASRERLLPALGKQLGLKRLN
jgi:hypothetical protein